MLLYHLPKYENLVDCAFISTESTPVLPSYLFCDNFQNRFYLIKFSSDDGGNSLLYKKEEHELF